MSRVSAFLPVAVTGLLTLVSAPDARAFDLENLDAAISVEFGNPMLAYVDVNPDAPVVDVVFTGNDCEFGAARHVADGVWVAAGDPLDGWGCYSVMASITVAEEREDPLCAPFIGLKQVKMSGSSFSDSYTGSAADYSDATAGDEGHVCSNGKIELSGSATIYGDALAGPGKEIKTSGSAGVTGFTGTLVAPLVMEPVDSSAAALWNDNDNIPLSSDGKDPLNDKGEFKLSGGDHVDLPPGTYYLSKLVLSGGSTLGISGPTVIHATGKVDSSGGSIINARQLPSDLRIFSTGKDVKISGDSESYALVYAPGAKVERSGDSDYFGSLVGKELILSGSGGIHFGGGFTRHELETVTLTWFGGEI